MLNLLDPKYKEVIAPIVSQLRVADTPVATADVLLELKTIIAEEYDNTPINDYKSVWAVRVTTTMELMNVPVNSRKKPNWEPILDEIITHMASNSSGSAPTTSSTSPSSSATVSSSSSTISSSSSTVSSSFSSTAKPQPLADKDLIKIEAIYDEVGPAKRWVLSSGTVVEDEMETSALSCTVEHETDLLRRLWFFIDTLYDSSRINCRSKEKSSMASSASKNTDQSVGGKEAIRRKVTGRELDMVFRRSSDEKI